MITSMINGVDSMNIDEDNDNDNDNDMMILCNQWILLMMIYIII